MTLLLELSQQQMEEVVNWQLEVCTEDHNTVDMDDEENREAVDTFNEDAAIAVEAQKPISEQMSWRQVLGGAGVHEEQWIHNNMVIQFSHIHSMTMPVVFHGKDRQDPLPVELRNCSDGPEIYSPERYCKLARVANFEVVSESFADWLESDGAPGWKDLSAEVASNYGIASGIGEAPHFDIGLVGGMEGGHVVSRGARLLHEIPSVVNPRDEALRPQQQLQVWLIVFSVGRKLCWMTVSTVHLMLLNLMLSPEPLETLKADRSAIGNVVARVWIWLGNQGGLEGVDHGLEVLGDRVVPVHKAIALLGEMEVVVKGLSGDTRKVTGVAVNAGVQGCKLGGGIGGVDSQVDQGREGKTLWGLARGSLWGGSEKTGKLFCD
ncbi:hypothetical protein BDK51DRAFT_34743 [Blyttiomyces helicus]|uniref:Uncharacterized protein n=1 Tax=Blyttiomyces helicus TaxID=388810 RepID=A0A4P9WPY6_9FUNG|nr:hypothetical protein BDK51DRAFT_34743 [Blyttiomyces helicus]|eukprot:RKO92896.1 hypothetical protein BDK51DRAFT_34743 [Blyttiomyces helicus]